MRESQEIKQSTQDATLRKSTFTCTQETKEKNNSQIFIQWMSSEGSHDTPLYALSEALFLEILDAPALEFERVSIFFMKHLRNETWAILKQF